MAELNTVARPYAKAVFQVAQADDSVAEWEGVLSVLGQVVSDERVERLLTNPRVSQEKKAEFLLAFVKDSPVLGKVSNLIHILLENHRIGLIAQMSVVFSELRAQTEKSCEAVMVTAVRASADIKKMVSAALEKRLDCTVNLKTRVNKDILGGAIIRVGDFVIDGSIATQLQRLQTVLAK